MMNVSTTTSSRDWITHGDSYFPAGDPQPTPFPLRLGYLRSHLSRGVRCVTVVLLKQVPGASLLLLRHRCIRHILHGGASLFKIQQHNFPLSPSSLNPRGDTASLSSRSRQRGSSTMKRQERLDYFIRISTLLGSETT